MTIKLPKMNKTEIDKLIQEQQLCRIAFTGEEHPYVAPFQYVVINGYLYFHFTNYGRKMKFLKIGKPVCVEIESYDLDLSEYRFVLLIGRLKIVTNVKERATAIRIMAEDGEKRLSRRFLAAHGFKEEDGWSSFTPDKPIIMVKLEEVDMEIGLRSP